MNDVFDWEGDGNVKVSLAGLCTLVALAFREEATMGRFDAKTPLQLIPAHPIEMFCPFGSSKAGG